MSKKPNFAPRTADMFQTSDDDQKKNTKPTSAKTASAVKASKPKTTKKPSNAIADKSAEESKIINHSPRRTKRASETRSQRKQFVFTKTVSKDLLIVAKSNGISENEAVNQAVEAYLKKEFRKESRKKRQEKVVSKLLNQFE